MKRHLPLLWVVFFFVQIVYGQEWKKIIPLKSTRADVEKILGPPKEKNRHARYGFVYQVSDGEVNIDYAIERCKGEPPGFNVEPETVLMVSFSPTKGQPNDIAKYELKDYITFSTDTLSKLYIDPQKGLMYIFYLDGSLREITVTPKLSDNNLRCEGFPPYNTAGAFSIPADSYRKTDIETAEFYVDIFTTGKPEGVKVYIVAYSGSNLSGKKYNNYLQRIRRYIRTRKGVDPKDVIVIDGGKKELFEVKLYVLSKDAPPMPRPDW